MAKLFSSKFFDNFGESFLQTIENERNRKQQQQQFDREMSFNFRRMNLYNEIQRDQLDQRQSQFETQEERLKDTGLARLYEQGFGNALGRTNERTGEFDKEGDEPTVNLYGEELTFPEPKKGDPLTQSEIITDFGGMLEGKYQVIDGQKVYTDFNNLRSPQTTTSGGGDGKGNDPYKEGKLSEAGAKALGFFTEPNISGGFLGIFGGDSDTDVKQMIADNMATFSKDILKSDSYQYVRDTFDTMGYVTPEVLRQNAMNDYNKGLINDTQANEIATFLNYYDTMYDGIQQLEEAID